MLGRWERRVIAFEVLNANPWALGNLASRLWTCPEAEPLSTLCCTCRHVVDGVAVLSEIVRRDEQRANAAPANGTDAPQAWRKPGAV